MAEKHIELSPGYEQILRRITALPRGERAPVVESYMRAVDGNLTETHDTGKSFEQAVIFRRELNRVDRVKR